MLNSLKERYLNNSNLLNILLSVMYLSITLIFLYLSILANSDLLGGRHELFVDERITFDGVKKILHPINFKNFLWSILNGGDQRYGRILWNSIAFFAFIPDLIFGSSGQIFSGRILQSLLVISTCLVFSFGLLRTWLFRIILALSLYTLPYVDYYTTMPKPEPLQTLFLALFILFLFKYKFNFGWHYIFAGLAFGSKISTLFPLVAIILFSLYIYRFSSRNFRVYLVTTGYFLIGLAVAVPILILPILFIIFGFFITLKINREVNIKPQNFLYLILLTITPILIFYNNFIHAWLNGTFYNTSHGADRLSTGFIEWINYFLDVWFISPITLNIALITSLFIFLFLGTSRFTFAVILSGFASIFGIFLFSHRLWGFYLYPGMVILIFGVLLAIENKFLVYRSYSFRLLSFTASIIFLCLFLQIIFIYWMPNTIKNFYVLSARTKNQDYIFDSLSYAEAIETLGNLSREKGRPINVMYSPALFWAESTTNYTTEEFWGPYTRWSEPFDAVFLHRDSTPQGPKFPVDSPLYQSYLYEQQGYRDHVVFERGASCNLKPCFYRASTMPNGGQILIYIGK
jgi:Na+-transporting methylmalonyl-CoA/oxaloacetate decarboxylase gamma subunit